MRLFSQYLQSNSGVFAIKMALLLPVFLIVVGFAIDQTRLISAHSLAQDAVDSAALNAAKLYSEDNPKYVRSARKNMKSNLLGRNSQITLTQFSVEPTDRNTVIAKAKGSLKPMFITIFGYPRLDLAVTSEVAYKQAPVIEIALVVDHTASLLYYRAFDELVDALGVFVDEIAGNNEDMGRLYISFIPFGGTVNVGPDKTRWLKTYSPSSYYPGEWGGCVMARRYGHDVTDATPVGNRKFKPYIWKNDVTYNDWNAKSDPSTFYGIHPRNRGHVGIEFGPNKGCENPLLSLTNRRSNVINAIKTYEKTMVRTIGTFTPVGIVWGHRTLSPKWRGLWRGPTPSNLPARSSKKYMIFLTDGEPRWNYLDPKKYPGNGHYSVYGFPDENGLGIKNTRNHYQVRNALTQKLVKACENAKKSNITMYTIAYVIPAGNRKALKKCASREDTFFDTPSKSQIEKVFRQIATEIKIDNGLRITH